MAKRIIFIHGRDIKPLENDLRELWYDAVKSGLLRDHGQSAVDLFDSTSKDFVYFGDLSNDFLNAGKSDDIISRHAALEKLKKYKAEDYNGTVYNFLPGKDASKEALADTFSGLLSFFNVGNSLISHVAPDMEHYWDIKTDYGSRVRKKLTHFLENAFDNDDDIMLVSHSLGTMISYDNLWKFSHSSPYKEKYQGNKKVGLWVTMGSPLGDENVKKHLKGSQTKGRSKYPHTIGKWVNISAEDDYISHDNEISNDFIEMYHEELLNEPVQDIYPIYNLTVRNNQSNPHSSIGYLIHPQFTELMFNWMSR